MPTLEEIKRPVEKEMEIFESKFRASMKSSVPLLDRITHYIVKRKGKQLRPLFVFLSAKMCGEINDSSYRAAALIELLHTATLVHDDVVDDAYQRRGFFSLNALWKNKIAVLVGDYLLSRGLLLSVENEEFDMLRITSKAVREMSEGELLQIEKTRKLDIAEDVYFEIIRQKTATLIASCCESGAASVGSDKEVRKKMWDFGENAGIAFQIKDDLFDYGSPEVSGKTGKPTGIDIQEKKITLPLLYTLNRASWMDKRRYINIVKNHNRDKKKVRELFEAVQEAGGIDYARKTMLEYRDKALLTLEDLPDNQARNSLRDLLNYTVNRER